MLARSIPLTLGACLLGTSTFAQAICEGGIWVSGAEESSDIAVAEAFVDRQVAVVANGADATLFTLSAPASLRLEAAGIGGGDTVLALRNAEGRTLAEDDDGGGQLTSRIETELEPGRYCLITRAIGDDAISAMVRIGRQEHDALTAGSGGGSDGSEACRPDAEAETLAIVNAADLKGAGVAGTAPARDVSAYRFTLPEPSALSITATGNDADPAIRLFDRAGTLVAENDDADGLNARISLPDALAAGDYCLAVRAVSDAAVPITVSVAAFNIAAAARRLYASGEASPQIDSSYPITDLGAVETIVSRDFVAKSEMAWFAFDMQAPGLMLVEGLGVGPVDPQIVLFDVVGRRIGADTDGGLGTNARLAAPLQPGRYLVGIGREGSGGFGLLRLVLQRYVAAE